VALISFRGPSARTEVTSSAGRAILAQTIRELGGGGGTPLREALDEAFALSQRRRWRPASIAKQLVLLTDGRTREAVDAQIAVPAGLELTVVDCERTSLRLARSRGLAAALSARYLHVDEL
jgi:magnesium chelatase subunit ChlD-like protein